jgi:hypothetical protein
LLGREISKQLKSLFQKQSVISDKNSATSNKKRRIGFRQLLRRVGIITSQSWEKLSRKLYTQFKHDIEVNKPDIESSQSVPLENTTKKITLNEELAG